MVNYKLKEKKIITGEEFIKLGEEKSYILISRDRSKITYRAANKTYGFEKPEEKVRAYFLVKLIEKYKYDENDIQLDVEIPGYKIVKSADLVVYRHSKPYIAAECRKEDISKSEIEKTINEVIEKAKILKAEYGVAVIGYFQRVFKIKGEIKEIIDIPQNRNFLGNS